MTNSNDNVPPVAESSHCSCRLPAGLRSKNLPLWSFPGHFICVYKKGHGFSDNKSSRSELRSPNWLIVLGVECLDDPLLAPPKSRLLPRCPSHHLLQPITSWSATHAATRLTLCYPGPAVISCWPFEKNLSIKLFGNNTFEKEKANTEKNNKKLVLCWCDGGGIIRMFFHLTNISVFGWKIISSHRELLDFYKFKQAKDRKQNLDKRQCVCQLIPLWFKTLCYTWTTSILG